MKAIYFGTFAPLHKGHVSNIIYAKRKYEHVTVFVSGYTMDRGEKANMPLLDRYRVIREVFNKDELVTVEMINEDNIEKYPLGWDMWLDEIESKVYDINNCVFICGEKEYQEELEKRGYKVDFMDRSVIPISATKIRENPYLNWEYIHKKFRKFFVKKVLIYGTASTGKTTLTKDLANYYNTTYTVEYAREYEDKYNVLDDELDIRDLTNIGIGQFNKNKNKIGSTKTNKFFFADTDVMTTKVYLKEYSYDDANYMSVKNIFNGLIDKQKWDLILFLQPDTEYVNDGFRDMNHANEDRRYNMNKMFEKVLQDNNLKYLELTGNYMEKFNKAVIECDKLI